MLGFKRGCTEKTKEKTKSDYMRQWMGNSVGKFVRKTLDDLINLHPVDILEDQICSRQCQK